MKKFGSDFEQHIYTLIRNGMKDEISGKVYRSGMRPFNSDKEDIVVSFLAGDDGQFQMSVVNINIFVPDITLNGQKYKNTTRLSALESAFKDFFYSITPDEHLLSLDGLPVIQPVEGVEQHFINIRISIKYNSLN